MFEYYVCAITFWIVALEIQLYFNFYVLFLKLVKLAVNISFQKLIFTWKCVYFSLSVASA